MKPNWEMGDQVTLSASDGVFTPGEPLIVCGPPGEYTSRRTGQSSTRKDHTVLTRPHNIDKDSGHYWVRDELIIPTITQEDVDDAIQSILQGRPEDVPEEDVPDIRTRLENLASEWMRNEERNADYQDGLADAAEQLRAVLGKEV